MRPTDVRIRAVSFGFQDFRYRTPLKFGGVPVTEVTLLNVTMTVETAAGVVASAVGCKLVLERKNALGFQRFELGAALFDE